MRERESKLLTAAGIQKARAVKAARSVADDVSAAEKPKRNTRRDTYRDTSKQAQVPERKMRHAAALHKQRADLEEKVLKRKMSMARAVREMKKRERDGLKMRA
jgi:hypothetical protein